MFKITHALLPTAENGTLHHKFTSGPFLFYFYSSRCCFPVPKSLHIIPYHSLFVLVLVNHSVASPPLFPSSVAFKIGSYANRGPDSRKVQVSRLLILGEVNATGNPISPIREGFIPLDEFWGEPAIAYLPSLLLQQGNLSTEGTPSKEGACYNPGSNSRLL